MLVESPTPVTRKLLRKAACAPPATAPAPLRASSAAASRPLRARAASSLHALHYASGVRGYAAHLDTPPRASKVTPRSARLRSKVARRGRRSSWKRRLSSARPLQRWVAPTWWARSPPRTGSAKPRGAAPELAVHYAHGGRATSHTGPMGVTSSHFTIDVRGVFGVGRAA
jgi:hypothetical protein